MSKVTTVYNALQALIEANLTSYSKIPNPYVVDDNVALLLTKGYGIGYGAGENTERQVGCFLSINRLFTVVLVNQVTVTENNLTGISSLEKALMEDAVTLLDALEQDADLQGNSIKAVYRSDSGIGFIDSELGKYLLLEIEVGIEYLENLT